MKILQRGQNCWRIGKVRDAGLLIDGRDYYRAFYQAACAARRYILIAGWQFDSEVCLLRGEDAHSANGELYLLPFLNSLCERNPSLQVYLLAWDFNMLYALKREFLQAWWFNWTTSQRLRFRFDSSHPLGASHHQKFVVIDGRIGFVGGMDICSGYWDDREHRTRHPHRLNADKKCYQPRHDVQAYFIGPAVVELARLFKQRWRFAGGGRLRLPARCRTPVQIEPTVRIAANTIALSRTQGRTILPEQSSVREIRALYKDAIAEAENLIYIESQYFSARAVYNALNARMRAHGRSRLQIVIMLPRQPEAFFEEIGLGTTQAKYLRWLMRTAQRTGHAFGVYNSRAAGRNLRRVKTYIHSKLMIVDDRFLTVGSANASNRSMGFDSELNVCFEAGNGDWALIQSIRDARASLLAEHCGLIADQDLERLSNAEDLVAFLESVAQRRRSRLCHHKAIKNALSEWVTKWTPHSLLIDPRESALAERIHEVISTDRNGLFARGIVALNKWLYGKRKPS
jgi:phosphatidylserine/phosphatidylglycerophosphate/cardiolipin synthase-like enzyme